MGVGQNPDTSSRVTCLLCGAFSGGPRSPNSSSLVSRALGFLDKIAEARPTRQDAAEAENLAGGLSWIHRGPGLLPRKGGWGLGPRRGGGAHELTGGTTLSLVLVSVLQQRDMPDWEQLQHLLEIWSNHVQQALHHETPEGPKWPWVHISLCSQT